MPQLCDANGEIAHEHTPCLRPRRQETGGHKYSLKLRRLLRDVACVWPALRNKIQQRWDGCCAECCDRLAGAKCENFIMGGTVGFRANLESVRSCDAMYRVRESKSKLQLLYRLFVELFS